MKIQRTGVREHEFAGVVVTGAQGDQLQEVGIEKQLHLDYGTTDLLKFCEVSLHSCWLRLTATHSRLWTNASTIQINCPDHHFRPAGYWPPIRIQYVLRQA